MVLYPTLSATVEKAARRRAKLMEQAEVMSALARQSRAVTRGRWLVVTSEVESILARSRKGYEESRLLLTRKTQSFLRGA
jgi:hypothetical protein